MNFFIELNVWCQSSQRMKSRERTKNSLKRSQWMRRPEKDQLSYMINKGKSSRKRKESPSSTCIPKSLRVLKRLHYVKQFHSDLELTLKDCKALSGKALQSNLFSSAGQVSSTSSRSFQKTSFLVISSSRNSYPYLFYKSIKGNQELQKAKLMGIKRFGSIQPIHHFDFVTLFS